VGFLVPVPGEHEDFPFAGAAEQLRDAFHDRSVAQGQIEQNHVRRLALGEGQGFGKACRFPGQDQPVFRLNQAAQPQPHQVVVLGEQYADHVSSFRHHRQSRCRLLHR
jgi:hypothetical protein